jgi:glutathionylspermidine synthase
MRRHNVAPRADLAARAQELGFTLHREDGPLYWDESAFYSFSLQQIERDLETPAEELHHMALDVVDRACRDEATLRRLAIPEFLWSLIADSWRAREPTLYGRFDFSYDGRGPAKLLEYNADTPTSLYEAAVFQWMWLEDLMAQGLLPQGVDQFTSLHDKLVARFGEVAPQGLHFVGLRDNVEDRLCLDYLEDCARQAGVATTALDMTEIGLSADERFVDLADAPIKTCFKLYPWEWLAKDEFGKSRALRKTRFLEPPWKAILSNKGFLALLYALDPKHPNILPAFFDDDPRRAELGRRFARKPLLSREGANVTLTSGEATVVEAGPYGAEGHIVQALAPLPDFDGRRPVIGAWIVGDQAAGIGLREDDGPITTDRSRFVPHIILD